MHPRVILLSRRRRKGILAGRSLTSAFIHIPITRQNRGSEWEVALGHLPFLEPESVANVQPIGSLPSVRFERRLGLVPAAELKAVKVALGKACAL
jgi:mRNA-degrading endonuclease toxin of MazEF toxin-antitoxin module